MSKVEISSKNMTLAQKSLKNLYLIKFGDDSLSANTQYFSKDELILRYAKNLRFWSDNLPEIKPGFNQFTAAKHAICTNAINQLWIKIDEYGIRKEVDITANKLI